MPNTKHEYVHYAKCVELLDKHRWYQQPRVDGRPVGQQKTRRWVVQDSMFSSGLRTAYAISKQRRIEPNLHIAAIISSPNHPPNSWQSQIPSSTWFHDQCQQTTVILLGSMLFEQIQQRVVGVWGAPFNSKN